jgi:hypothetical protein
LSVSQILITAENYPQVQSHHKNKAIKGLNPITSKSVKCSSGVQVVIITTVIAIVQAPSVPELIINTDCTKQWYIPVYTIICWHLGDTKQRVMPMNVKEWSDNPSEFIPDVHNHIGVTVLHTVGLT